MMAMETSSPLAALQSSKHHWNHTRNAPEFDNGFLRPCRPARDFNFKEMSMRKSNSDYFSFKPARGSSPTQSLAVDLSQNFHIDRRYRLSNALADWRFQENAMLICPVLPYQRHADPSSLPHLYGTGRVRDSVMVITKLLLTQNQRMSSPRPYLLPRLSLKTSVWSARLYLISFLYKSRPRRFLCAHLRRILHLLQRQQDPQLSYVAQTHSQNSQNSN